MTMLSLLRADFFKARKGGMLWWLWGFMVLFVAGEMLLSTLVLHLNVAYPFPSSLLTVGPIMQSVGLLLLIGFSGELVGTEYTNDTWKNILTRHPGRMNFIFSKWITLILSLAVALVIMLFFAMVLGFILQTTLHLSGQDTTLSLGNVLLLVLAQTVMATVLGTLTLLGAVVGHSHVAGIIIGIVWLFFDQALGQLVTGNWKLLSFIQASQSLQAHLMGNDTPYSVVPDLLVLAAYLILPVLLAAYIFRQRDILGKA
ncbi:MAG: ABC transporter permease [Ktedonobacteraceae bacterium]